MADGHARLTGELAICAATSGPGATNILTGAAVAFADGIPMLILTGQAPSHTFGKGASQETGREDIDIVGMFKPVTRYSAMIQSPGHALHHLNRALRKAHEGRKGPVHLNIPVNIWQHELPPATRAGWDPATRLEPVCDLSGVERAIEALEGARCPALLAGSGVWSANAREQLITLAERLHLPTATTPRAKGVFPEDHPLSLGVLGFGGHKEARELLMSDAVDVLMVVGASLNEPTTFNWSPALRPSRCMIHLDIDPERIGRNYPVEVAVQGDAGACLARMLEKIRPPLMPRSMPPLRPLPEDSAALRERVTGPLTPQRWRYELQRALPEEAVIFSDIGGHMLFNIHDLRLTYDQRFVLNLGFGSMGHGTAAPIGAALASKHPVFSIIGDACFTMQGMELLTAVEHDVPVIWIVENNQMHGITWHGSQVVGDGTPMDIVRNRKTLNASAIARAMGLEAWRVDAPGQLARRIAEALACGGPALIEVMVDPSISPPLGDRARTIAGFRNG